MERLIMKKITIVIAFAVVLGFAQQGLSQESNLDSSEFKKVQNKIELVIADQLKAFTRLDVDRAYYHASKSIKTMFPSSEIFGLMVKKLYPMIWAPKSYKFLAALPLSNGVVQKVMFTDIEGGMHFFDYALENNGKRWVISGVYMVKGSEGA